VLSEVVLSSPLGEVVRGQSFDTTCRFKKENKQNKQKKNKIKKNTQTNLIFDLFQEERTKKKRKEKKKGRKRKEKEKKNKK
jgi:hypothetical protein